MLAIMYPLEGDQKSCKKQSTPAAAEAYWEFGDPSEATKSDPSIKARYWEARVKKDDPLTSSHKSNPVWFQYVT